MLAYGSLFVNLNSTLPTVPPSAPHLNSSLPRISFEANLKAAKYVAGDRPEAGWAP